MLMWAAMERNEKEKGADRKAISPWSPSLSAQMPTSGPLPWLTPNRKGLKSKNTPSGWKARQVPQCVILDRNRLADFRTLQWKVGEKNYFWGKKDKDTAKWLDMSTKAHQEMTEVPAAAIMGVVDLGNHWS